MTQRYDDMAKEKAYRLFVIGKSITEIAKELKAEWPTVSKSTVAKWAKEKDARGLTWDERRTQVVVARNANLDLKLGEDKKKILEQSQQIKETLFSKMGRADVKTLEGAIFAYDKICRFIMELSEDSRENPHPMEVVRMLMEVFCEIPEVRAVIEAHWESIQRSIALRLDSRG